MHCVQMWNNIYSFFFAIESMHGAYYGLISEIINNI